VYVKNLYLVFVADFNNSVHISTDTLYNVYNVPLIGARTPIKVFW